jgi:hypothetical protein
MAHPSILPLKPFQGDGGTFQSWWQVVLVAIIGGTGFLGIITICWGIIKCLKLYQTVSASIPYVIFVPIAHQLPFL